MNIEDKKVRLIEKIIKELKTRRDWNNPEEVEDWFSKKLYEVYSEARREEKEEKV